MNKPRTMIDLMQTSVCRARNTHPMRDVISPLTGVTAHVAYLFVYVCLRTSMSDSSGDTIAR